MSNKIYNRNRRLTAPWVYTLYEIRKRCNNVNSKRYKDYGGKGIKCLITSEEIKELWFRDKAFEMKKPSIDRKNNKGNYNFKNCRFLELKENSCKDKRKAILQFDLNGVFIKEYISLNEASRQTGCCLSEICKTAKYQANSTNGFIWRYKNA